MKRERADSRGRGRVEAAYHEAGHAVMALALGLPVQSVTIEPNLGSAEGFEDRPYPKAELSREHDSATWRRLLTTVAGPVAEVMFLRPTPYHEPVHIDWEVECPEVWADDRDVSLECCGALYRDSPAEALQEAELASWCLLRARWPEVEELAERLQTEAVVHLVSDDVLEAIGDRRALHAALAEVASIAGMWCKEADDARDNPDEMERVGGLTAQTMVAIMLRAAEVLEDEGVAVGPAVEVAVARLSGLDRRH
jgi:hypothetical protein